MFLYIEITDVVGNAFVELLSRQEKRRLYYYELDRYGAKAVEVLNREAGIHAVYVVSQDSQHDICVSYSDLFSEFTDEDGAKGIELIKDISADEIWKRFCAALSIKVMLAFQKREVVAQLG